MVTAAQINALGSIILNSPSGSPLIKTILGDLLRISKGLTEEVYFTLSQDEGFTREEIHEHALSIDGILSSLGDGLNDLMAKMGTPFRFYISYGHFDERGMFNRVGMFPGRPGHEHEPRDMPARYTFWCAKEGENGYSDAARPVEKNFVMAG